MSTRALLLYSPAGGGHRAAAHAVAEAISAQDPAATVEVRDVCEFAPAWFRYDRAWSLLQRHGAYAWDWMFDATDRAEAEAIDAIRLPLHRALFAGLDRHLRATRPTHIVSTHYLPAIAVARVKRAIGARAITVVTDHQIHRAWLAPDADAICVADLAGARAALRRRADRAIAVTGIPIARACAAPTRAVAAELARARILALLGGVPAGPACAAIASLAPLARDHDLEILTGDDPVVQRACAAAFAGTEAIVRARAPGLVGALDAADVVVTKAGGLSVSEGLARGRALVLPFGAPGQERGNLRHALASGAALQPDEPADVGAAVRGLIDEPGRLRRMGARARLAARPDAA
ncbi:MAG: hypothetical protein K8W52_05605, partial [Deltaproteobacteria bacterium]|nr:hypothetical protein [Deltaproteobacteria bacterium]